MNSIRIETTIADGHCITCRIGNKYVELMYNQSRVCIIVTVNNKPMLPAVFEAQYKNYTSYDKIIALKEDQEAVPTPPLKEDNLDFDDLNCFWICSQDPLNPVDNLVSTMKSAFNTTLWNSGFVKLWA